METEKWTNEIYQMSQTVKKDAIDTIKTQVYEDAGDGVYGTDLMESLVRMSRRIHVNVGDEQRVVVVSALEDINDSDHYDDAEYLIKQLSINIAIQSDENTRFENESGFYINPDDIDSKEAEIKKQITDLLVLTKKAN